MISFFQVDRSDYLNKHLQRNTSLEFFSIYNISQYKEKKKRGKYIHTILVGILEILKL